MPETVRTTALTAPPPATTLDPASLCAKRGGFDVNPGAATATIATATVLTTATTYRFGEFELDPAGERLTRGDELLTLQPRPFAVLVCLVAHAGKLVTKQMLTDHAWRNVAVVDNSIVQAVSAVRQVLGNQPDGRPYIDTVSGKGYRFVARVEAGQPVLSPAVVEVMLEPYRPFLEARPSLESLNRDDIERVRQALETVLRLAPSSIAARVGLANAELLDFESSRTDATPRRERLIAAEQRVLEACAMSPDHDDAWITLALARHRLGNGRDAIAAARKATELRPTAWRHWLRLAEVSAGEERLIAAQRVGAACPDVAIARWYTAIVFVARGQLAAARSELRAGCLIRDDATATAYPAVGLHWLHGLVLAAVGDDEGALAELERELATTDVRHVYGREACANAWYTIGVIHLRLGRCDRAQAAFHSALALIAGHRLSQIALSGGTLVNALAAGSQSSGVDVATAVAIGLALQGKHEAAERIFSSAYALAPPGSAGWILPVEPALHVATRPEIWTRALAALRARWL